MNQAHLAVDLINWGVNVAFLIPFLFPAYIRLIWAWEKDEWGWNIVLLDLAVSLAILPTFVHRVAGIRFYAPVFLWLEAASLWLIPSIVVWRSAMIWRKQRHVSKKKPKREEKEKVEKLWVSLSISAMSGPRWPCSRRRT